MVMKPATIAKLAFFSRVIFIKKTFYRSCSARDQFSRLVIKIALVSLKYSELSTDEKYLGDSNSQRSTWLNWAHWTLSLLRNRGVTGNEEGLTPLPENICLCMQSCLKISPCWILKLHKPACTWKFYKLLWTRRVTRFLVLNEITESTCHMGVKKFIHSLSHMLKRICCLWFWGTSSSNNLTNRVCTVFWSI